MVLDASLFNTQPFNVRIKGKCSQPGKRIAPSPVVVAIQVTLDYGRPTSIYLSIYLEREREEGMGVREIRASSTT